MRKIIFLMCLIIGIAFSSCEDESSTNNGTIKADTGQDIVSSDTAQKADFAKDAANSDADIIIDPDEKFIARPLNSIIDKVQPMTGIVLWEDSWNDGTTKDDIQVEYAYYPPNKIITAKDTYDWSDFDAFLDRVAARGHQAMPRFYYAYVGRETVVPDYVKNQNSYSETRGTSEGETTWFPDWRNNELQEATIRFMEAFAARYDEDPRIAFLQVGFGLWGEYHIYDGPTELGKDFPSHAFQARFIETLDTNLETLKWSISIDAGYGTLSAFPANTNLLSAKFGVFDDSFMHEKHREENEPNWTFFGYEERFLSSPHGGEFSYFTNFDQRNVLNPAGLHGKTFEAFSKRFYISYMIGNDQPDYEFKTRIKEAGMATGYKFEVIGFESSEKNTRIDVKNNGVAPIYYDAYPTIDGERSKASLKGLAPGEGKQFIIGKPVGQLSITSDHLVEGQVIQFDANL